MRAGRTALGGRPTGRPRAHALAPAHLGDLGAVAVLAMGIMGVAMLIAATTVIVAGITAPVRFAGAPNAADLGTGQLLGGVGAFAIGLLEIGAAVALVAAARFARVAAVGLNLGVAVLAAVGAYLVYSRGVDPDRLMAGTLATASLASLIAAAILTRR